MMVRVQTEEGVLFWFDPEESLQSWSPEEGKDTLFQSKKGNFIKYSPIDKKFRKLSEEDAFDWFCEKDLGKTAFELFPLFVASRTL